MAPGLQYFSFEKNSNYCANTANSDAASAPAKQSPRRALPASWYTSPEMYEFERRAIFSRRWLFITHSSRLATAGSFLRYKIAGYDFFINRDRSGNINAFHNVCRHRAYPVVEKEEGSARILACRYHGWSYGMDGKLAKAPGYGDLADYDKEKNGLLRIHTKVDCNGFVWVNMDAKEVPEVPWEEHFAAVDRQDRYKGFDFANYDLDHTYEIRGDFNWKILADNFNECYHCPTTHVDVQAFINLESFDSKLQGGHIQHEYESTPEQEEKGLGVASTYYFPATSMTVSPHFIMVQKFLPSSATSSTMHYEIYRNRNSSDEDFHLIADMYARVMKEDKVLCAGVQENLNAGVFVNGQLHPRYEKAPLFFQKNCRDVIEEWWEREKREGRKIWPAKREVPADDARSTRDAEICDGIMCASGAPERLTW